MMPVCPKVTLSVWSFKQGSKKTYMYSAVAIEPIISYEFRNYLDSLFTTLTKGEYMKSDWETNAAHL